MFFGLFAGMAGLAGLAGGGGGSSSNAVSQPTDPDGQTTAGRQPASEQSGAYNPGPDDYVDPDAPDPDAPSTPDPDATPDTPSTPDPDATPDTPSTPDPDATPDAPDTVDVDITVPQAPEQVQDASDDAIAPTDLDAAQASAVAGRVKTFDLNDNSIAEVEVVSGPAYGNVTVNPDNTLALVLSGTEETSDISFDLRVTYKNGSVQNETVNVDVVDGEQAAGWGTGDFYMLETDENDDVVVEHGENHRKVYVSGDNDALTLADIAALEGMDVDKVNGNFLASNPEYGSDPDMALAEDAGLALWKTITGPKVDANSNWLLLERGYEYDGMDNVIENGTAGESELHPVYVGAYGDGDDPVVTTQVTIMRDGNENIVLQGIDFTGRIDALRGENILFDDISVSGDPLNIQNIESFTLRNSEVVDVVQDAPKNDTGTWDPGSDRESGIYVSNSHGVLIEDTLFDHNGWGDGYDYNRSSDDPQAPSKFSHNAYLQYTNTDVTFRDNIVMQGAGTGAQIRSGGFIEDNIFIDNNGHVMFATGQDTEGNDAAGNYTLFTGNVATSGAHKDTDLGTGALTKGVTNKGHMATLVDNIVTHLADPNNAQELEDKQVTQDALINDFTPVYDDTIIHNWVGSKAGFDQEHQNANTDGLNTDILNETTIQTFTAQLLGKSTATITDLADYLRAQADGQFDDVVDADLIIDFFQTGFGLQTDLRSDAETLRFIPNELGDGIRWDNRLNWSTEDLPGVQDGDRVELGGNWVEYSGTTTLEDLDFGEGGKLNVTQGSLTIEDHISVGEKGATLSIDKAGQLWTDGYTDQDMLTIDAAGGRFANTGLFTGKADLTASDNAQVLLATDDADYIMGKDSNLEIIGDDTRVGFDGENGGTGVLLMDKGADLSFTADETGTLGTIEEFYSGAFEGAPDIQSGVNLGEATLHLDINSIAGGAARSDTLIEVDELIGDFDSLEIVGLGNNQDATVTIDYENDTVMLSLGADGKGSGDISLKTAGDENDAQANADLWAALTNGHGIYPEDRAVDIPDEEDDDIEA